MTKLNMKWSVLLYLLVVGVHQSLASVDVFEFGVNVGRVEFSKTGRIGAWPSDKTTTIPIMLPPCTKLAYVRVEVDNIISPPAVSLDLNMQKVTIKYRLIQYSISSYSVVAKATPIEGCQQ